LILFKAYFYCFNNFLAGVKNHGLKPHGVSGSQSPKKCLCFLWAKAHSVRKEHFLCVKNPEYLISFLLYKIASG